MSIPDAETVERVYAARFPEADRRAKARIWQVLVENYFQQWVRPDDAVLDLGCGFGEFLNSVQAGRRIGVDLHSEGSSHLAAGVEYHQGSVTDLAFLPDASVDVVFTSNLMEHLPSKAEVEQMLRESLRVLRPGGTFMALGPNLRIVPGAYWDFWDHLVPITDRSLMEALTLAGFEIRSVTPRFLPYSTRSAIPQAPALVRLYLRVPVAWRVMGAQFFVRATRPSADSDRSPTG